MLYVSSGVFSYLIMRQITYIKTLSTIRCSSNSPFFLKKILIKSIYMNSLTNQISYKKNNSVYICTSGWKDSSHKVLNNANYVYRIASLSKLFTSSIILDMVNKQKLSLNSNLISKKDKFNEKQLYDIKILDLLRHSAGFDRSMSGDKVFQRKLWCGRNLISLLNQISLDFNPSEKMVYSNEGYCLLARLSEQYYDKDFNNILKENYKNIEFYSISNEYNDKEVFYEYKFSPIDSRFYHQYNLENLTGSADLVMSASNLMNAIDQMIDMKPYNILNIDYMLPCDINKFKSCYGLGMSPIKYKGNLFYNRDGVLPGSISYSFVTSNKNILVLLTNSMPYNIEQKSVKFKKMIMDGLQSDQNS